MSWNILLKAGLPLMVIPLVSLAATPAVSASIQNQLKLEDVSSDRHSILIAGWDNDDWKRDRRSHRREVHRLRRDIDRRLENLHDIDDRDDRRREVRRLRRDYRKLQRHRSRYDDYRYRDRDDDRYYRVRRPLPPVRPGY